MSEYEDDCSDNDYKEYKDNEEIEKEIDKEIDVEKEFTNDYDSQDLDSKEYDPFTPPDLTLKDDDSKEYDPFTPPDLTLKEDDSKEYNPFTPPDLTLKDDDSKEYNPFTPPDLTLKDDDSKEYDPFTPPDLTLKDDDSKEYDPFTPLDLTLKGESSNEEIEEDIIKKNEPEFIEERSIDHNITFDHIYERDLEDIVKDINQAEKLHAIYAEDIMIPSGDKEAVEHYYMEQMKAEGVIIANDLYFEETPEKTQVTLDHSNEPTTNSINKDKEQLNIELDPTIKANFTEIDGKEISLANDIDYENKIGESIEDGQKFNEHHEEIQIQEETNLDISKSEVKDIDKEQEVPQKYSSGQHATQILQQDVEEIPNQEPQETKEVKLNDTEEIQQNEVKKNLVPEVNNKVEKKKISQEIEKDHINSSSKKKESEITTKKSEFDHKNIEQEAEIKENKQEKIDNDIGFKEEWEKTLVEWIKGAKDEDLSSEKKVELIEFMRKYRNAREEHTRLHYLHLKHKKNEISEEEKQERTYIKEKIKEYDEIDEEMFKEFHAFRCFYDYNKKRWYDTITNSKKKRYPKLVAQKLQRLKDKKIKKRQDYQEQNLEELSKEISDESYELLKKRYNQETGGNAIYGKKETKGFKKWKEGLNETQEELNEVLSEASHEIKGEWANVLKSHIHDISNEEISQEIKEEMTNVIDNYTNLQKTSKNLPPKLRQVVEELRQFQATYNLYKERGYDKSIPREVGRVAKKLRKSIELIKNEAILGIVLGGNKRELQNFKEILSENLYKSTMNLNEKSEFIRIIQKEKLSEEDKEALKSILSKLPEEELNSLLGDSFNNLIHNRIESELTSNKQSQSIYTALDLIDDLMAEIQKYSEELATIWPERVQKYSYAMLSRLWGYKDAYVNVLIFRYKKDNDFRINNKALSRLKQRIITRYGKRASKCLKIIDNYKNSRINLNDFISSLCAELGRISGEVMFTHEEASQIFGINTYYKINDIEKKNPNYKFSLETLGIIEENIEFYFKEAENCYKLIQKYKNLNEDLKEYRRQQHNVGRPHYFKEILPGEYEKAYLFGFLGHDGYIGKSTRRIALAIHPKDIVVIYKLAEAIDLDLNNVKIADEHRTYLVNGEKRVRHSVRLDFRCKPMHEDLQRHGFIGSKMEQKEVPAQIKDLIKKAKQENLDKWMDTKAGKTALAWLLGFYDADGSYYKGYTSGRLYCANKEYLMDVKKLFEIKTKVNTLIDPGEKVWVIDRYSVSKGYYYLSISSKNVFIKMLMSYEHSLGRKRPDSEYLSSRFGFNR